MLRRRFYTDLDEPPFVDWPHMGIPEDDAQTKICHHPNGLFVCLNSLAWQSFRWELWVLVTDSPIHDDVSLETDDESPYLDFPTVPFSEIQLLTEEEMKSNFPEKNYIYRGHRVDFSVTREASYQAYLRFCAMVDEFNKPRAICCKLFDNLWVQLEE